MGTLNSLQVAASARRPDMNGPIMVSCHQHGATCMHGCCWRTNVMSRSAWHMQETVHNHGVVEMALCEMT